MYQIKLTSPTGGTSISVGRGLSTGLANLSQKPILLVDEYVLCEHHDLFSCFESLVIPSGESYKTLQTVEHIYRELVKMEERSES